MVYKDATLSYYDPSLDQLNVFSAGKNKAQYESFLTLGFGGSGKDLKAAWQITDLGPETVDGVATEKLDLQSDPAKGANIVHITVWVDPARAVSLKQIFYYTSGDTRTCTFTHIKYNIRSCRRVCLMFLRRRMWCRSKAFRRFVFASSLDGVCRGRWRGSGPRSRFRDIRQRRDSSGARHDEYCLRAVRTDVGFR